MQSNIIHVSPSARRILTKSNAHYRGTYDQLGVAEIILQLLASMAKRLDAIIERLGGDKSDQGDDGYSDANTSDGTPQSFEEIGAEVGLGKFDRSVGAQSEATQKHPMGAQSTTELEDAPVYRPDEEKERRYLRNQRAAPKNKPLGGASTQDAITRTRLAFLQLLASMAKRLDARPSCRLRGRERR
jgi:hypothetical protein